MSEDNNGMPAWLDEAPSAPPSAQSAARPASAAAPAIATPVHAAPVNENAANNTASVDPVTLQGELQMRSHKCDLVTGHTLFQCKAHASCIRMHNTCIRIRYTRTYSTTTLE